MKKTILITGSTDGIGKLAAIKLAKDGHTVYLHGRNADKLYKVIQEVKSATNNENVNGFVADFSDLKEVTQMANEILKQLPTLDVLVNNAGVYKAANPITKDGLDIRFVVNYLAPYVMTNTLLSLLKKSAVPRVINLSSAAQSTVLYDVFRGEKQVPDQAAYGQSKLALLMWSFYLSKQEPSITTTALNPGSLLNTNMVREAFGKFWSSADKGADIIYDIALLDAYEGVTGKYYDNDEGMFNKAHADAYNESKIEELINETNLILKRNLTYGV